MTSTDRGGKHPPPAGVEAAVPKNTQPSSRRGNSLPILILHLKTCPSFSLCGHDPTVLNVLPMKHRQFLQNRTVSYHGKSQSLERIGWSPPIVCFKTSFIASNYSLLMKVWGNQKSDFVNRDTNDMQTTFFFFKFFLKLSFVSHPQWNTSPKRRTCRKACPTGSLWLARSPYESPETSSGLDKKS